MIVQEHWPEMTQIWQYGVDDMLTEKLAALPVCSEVDFPYQERAVVHLASEDRNEAGVSAALGYSPRTTHILLGRASRKVRNFRRIYTEQHSLEDAALARAEEANLPLHGLVYALLDGGHIPVGHVLEPALLFPPEGLFIKCLALGYSLRASADLCSISESTRKQAFQPELEKKMGVDTPQGIVGNGFRMGFFAPSVPSKTLQLPKILRDE